MAGKKDRGEVVRRPDPDEEPEEPSQLRVRVRRSEPLPGLPSLGSCTRGFPGTPNSQSGVDPGLGRLNAWGRRYDAFEYADATWLAKDQNSVIVKNEPYEWWVKHDRKRLFARQVEEHYGVTEGDGYWCKVPSATDRLHMPPEGYTAIYVRMFEFGLRLPLDDFVTAVLIAYNISLAQLTPMSIKRLMSFLWTCIFMGLRPTLEAFNGVFKLAAITVADSKGWWSIQDRQGKLSAFPYVSSDKEWKGSWLWVRVPTKPNHPHLFGAPLKFTKPDPGMTAVGDLVVSEADKEVITWFGKKPDKDVQGKFSPTTWLPWSQFIFQEKVLAVCGLSRQYSGNLLNMVEAVLPWLFHFCLFVCLLWCEC